MKKWDYADESTIVCTVILIVLGILSLPILVLAYQEASIFMAIILVAVWIVFLIILIACYVFIFNKRSKRMRIEKYCDYKTYGKVVGIREQEIEVPDLDTPTSHSTYSIHLVVEYRDAGNVCRRFSTPGIHLRLRNHTLLDCLMCDVYIKGKDVLARNFREDTIFSKPTLEEMEERKKRKNLIKKYRIKGCLWIAAMLVWIGLWLVLIKFFLSGRIWAYVLFIGAFIFYGLYSCCHTEIKRITTGYYSLIEKVKATNDRIR